MADFDRRLRDALEALAEPPEPELSLERIATRKRRVRLARRLQAATLAVTVVVASTGVAAGLVRAFRGEQTRDDAGQPSQDAGVFFPTYSMSGGPGAIVSGRLIESDGCLFLRSFGKKLLPLWEEGYSYAEGTLLDSSGQPVVRVGEVLHGGGGHFSKWQHAEEIVGVPIPERCRPDGAEPWLLIRDVRAGPPADLDTSPPPPSKLERRVIGAFRRVGIDAGVAEHGYKDAWISGTWRGAEILVHAYHVSRADVTAIKSKMVGEAEVGGVRVLEGRNATFGVVRTLVCRGTEYQVTTLGETPNSNEAIGMFLPAFIDAVRCA